MDGFTYTNIFETKGIEYLVVIAFFAVLIPFWIALNKKVEIKKQIQNAIGILTASILKIPQGLFFSQNHTWTHLEKSGIAKVGVDDFLQHVTGQIQLSKLKTKDEIINKGDLLAEIKQDEKFLQIYSPISGKVIKANTILIENPERLNADPYNNGWIYEVIPFNWKKETNSYFMAEDASRWLMMELDRFKDFMNVSIKKRLPEPSMVTYQDGGELIDNTLMALPGEVWQDFQREFLTRV